MKSKTSKVVSISGGQTAEETPNPITDVPVPMMPLLDLKGAASLLNMSESWMRQQKDISFVRIGRRKLFRPEALNEYVKNRTRGGQKLSQRAGG